MMRYVVSSAMCVILLIPVAHAASSDITIEHFERLSYDLRGHRLNEAERGQIASAIADDPDKAYARHVDAWLTKDALKTYVDTFLGFPPIAVVTPDAETFFHRLRKQGDNGVYSLPHQPSCTAEEATLVNVWWQDEVVRVCPDSYRPETIFDDLGYCSGEAEPLMRQPPRPGCGCGPMLMGCLPPKGEHARLDELVVSSVMDEWLETSARIVAQGRPLDELVTTSRTWQTGLTEFLYLRRDIIGERRERAWSEDVSKDIAARIASIDVAAPGRWVERGGVYEGTGIWWTSMAPHALKIPIRGTAHHLLTRHLCSSFSAVNVDADAILAAVGEQHENLRTLSSLLAAPMRFQNGCKGCHAPMDGAAAFLPEIQAPLYGSYPTGQEAAGELFVTGSEDFRGKGNGIAALSRLVVSQPEFETCSVRRAFEEVLMRPMKSYDRELFQELVAEFRVNGHRWAPVIRALLLSDAYENVAYQHEAATSVMTGEVPELVTGIIERSCTACHNEHHPLDLTHPPAASEIALWKRILTRVSDSSMPPPSTTGEVVARFPMNPSVRKSFTASLRTMLGASLDGWDPPRRLEHRVWRSVVYELAGSSLGVERVDAILEPIVQKDGVFAKLLPRGLPPAYELAIERASEAVCRELSRVAPMSPMPAEELLTKVYGAPPTPSDLAEAYELLTRFEAVTESGGEAWTALCSTHLSGPRLFFELYTQGD